MSFYCTSFRQRQLEEERQLKLKQLTEAKERKKREKGENKFRRVQLAESCEFFKNVRNEIADIYEERRKLREVIVSLTSI